MDLGILEKIQRVEAPPFLFTRIQQKIEQTKKEMMPKVVAFTISTAFVLILVINTIVLTNHSTPSTTKSLVQSMHLTTNNSLY